MRDGLIHIGDHADRQAQAQVLFVPVLLGGGSHIQSCGQAAGLSIAANFDARFDQLLHDSRDILRRHPLVHQ